MTNKEMIALAQQMLRVDELIVEINKITKSEESFPILAMTKDCIDNLYLAKKSLLDYSRMLEDNLK